MAEKRRNGFFKKAAEKRGFHNDKPEKEDLAEFELSVEEAEAIKKQEERSADIPRIYGKLIQAVKRETKKEPRLIEELDKVIERPKRKKENIIFDFEELVLEKPKTLKKTLETLLGKKDEESEDEKVNEEIQEIINSLATDVADKSSETPKKGTTKKQAKPEVPNDSDRKAYIKAMITAIRKDPELRQAINKANLEPFRVKLYRNTLSADNEYYYETDEKITSIIYSEVADGSKKKAIDLGLLEEKEFVADERGNSTGIPFPEKEVSPKSGKS